MFPSYGRIPPKKVEPVIVNNNRETKDEYVDVAMKYGFSKEEAKTLYDGAQKAVEIVKKTDKK